MKIEEKTTINIKKRLRKKLARIKLDLDKESMSDVIEFVLLPAYKKVKA